MVYKEWEDNQTFKFADQDDFSPNNIDGDFFVFAKDKLQDNWILVESFVTYSEANTFIGIESTQFDSAKYYIIKNRKEME